MLLSKNISISRIISGSWKYLLYDTLTCILTFLAFEHFARENWSMPGLLPTILGTALAFFIAFNNNQAYDRWWEARKIWGALVNDSRTWARQLLHFRAPQAGPDQNQLLIRIMLFRHISFLYALKEKLRKSDAKDYLKYLSDEDITEADKESNKANALLNLQARDLNVLYDSGKIDGFQFMELNKILVKFCDGMGQSERIFGTVFPTTYSYYTRMFIWVFIVCATLVTAESMGPWSIFVGTLIGYVFLTIHRIGEFLLNPFEDMATGIPLNDITRTIEINILETLREEKVPEPVQSINGEYIM